MQDIFSSQTNYVINDKNKSDGMELMKNLKDETIKLCVFDPQYRGILDQLHYGDEGKSRNVDRCALPQMTEEKIVEFLTEISRVLKPSGHIFLWVDRFHLCEGSAHKWRKGLPLEVVDIFGFALLVIFLFGVEDGVKLISHLQHLVPERLLRAVRSHQECQPLF